MLPRNSPPMTMPAPSREIASIHTHPQTSDLYRWRRDPAAPLKHPRRHPGPPHARSESPVSGRLWHRCVRFSSHVVGQFIVPRESSRHGSRHTRSVPCWTRAVAWGVVFGIACGSDMFPLVFFVFLFSFLVFGFWFFPRTRPTTGNHPPHSAFR